MGAGRKRSVVALGALALLVGTHSPADATCSEGGTSTILAPTVTYLRSYRSAFGAPTRIATDSAGRVYITDPVKGQVLVRGPEGRVLSRGKGLGYPISVAVDGAGRIYVGDGQSGAVTAFGSDWQRLFFVGRGAGEFLMPNDMAVDPTTGNLYVTDSKFHLIKVFDGSGVLLFSFGGLGSSDGQFNFPAGIHVDPTAQEVLVTDQLNYRIQVFDLAGNFLRCFGSQGSSAGKFNMPQGIWTDAEGRVYVADAFEGRIQILDGAGAFIAYVGDFGEAPGQMRTPVDLAVDPSSRLLVASANNGRLEMFGLGSFTDPEQIVPAETKIQPDVVDRANPGRVFVADIEIPGYRLENVSASSITANGVNANPSPVSIGDQDNDNEPDLRVEFDWDPLAARLPAQGDAPVTVTGRIGDKDFEATQVLRVTDTDEDHDDDGIPDRDDSCPDTPRGAATDPGGCSLEQLCPCEGPEPGEEWRNHGEYVRCIEQAAREFEQAARIPAENRRAIVSEAARASCGEAP